MSARPPSRSRLAWRCRRGTKELDVLFERFLASGFENLPDSELGTLDRLLNQPDPDLFEWLCGRAPAPDPRLQSLVERIRGCLTPPD